MLSVRHAMDSAQILISVLLLHMCKTETKLLQSL